MGHTNYNKYQNISVQKDTEKKIINQDVEPVKTIEESPIESPIESPVTVLDTTIEENSKIETKQEEIIKGIVVNTKKVNIREKADINSNVLTIINEGTEMIIVDSTDEYFHKVLVNNINGYCMKKFVKIKEIN